MKYALARLKAEGEARAFRVYVTDALKAAYNLNMRYYDVVCPREPGKERSAEEIISSIVSKIEGMQNGD